MKHLPEAFIDRIRIQLGDEAAAFLNTYEHSPVRGLRVNPLKLHHEAISTIIKKFNLTPVPWCDTGFYYDPAVRPGKHPYHSAGLYYMQEPSAMSAVELLDPQPGELVLDLAAAPGGKSTQIAAKMNGQGVLIANEIHPARAKILSSNIERFGITNTIVTNCTPDELASRFSGRFDRVLLDAPCSGEGMFRKDPEAKNEWSLAQVERCAIRQRDVLQQAAEMVRPGGILTYSTCTFAPAENEEQIAAFLNDRPDYRIVRTEAIWPHKAKGEGHYVAVLERIDSGEIEFDACSMSQTIGGNRKKQKKKGKPSSVFSCDHAWKQLEQLLPNVAQTLTQLTIGEPAMFGSHLYWVPVHPRIPHIACHLEGLRVLRPGLHLAQEKNNRIEPAHALALANVKQQKMIPTVSFSDGEKEIAAFLRGECFDSPGENGWVAVSVDGFPLGWGKRTNGLMKNHYPKGLRQP